MSEASEQGAPVVPLAPEANEGLYFRLLLKGLGLDPKGFRFWRFAHQQGRRIKVRVFGRGSAAVYDVPETESWTSLFAHASALTSASRSRMRTANSPERSATSISGNVRFPTPNFVCSNDSRKCPSS